MEKLRSKGSFHNETKNYRRYRLSGDCVGTVYVPRRIKDSVVELELDLGLTRINIQGQTEQSTTTKGEKS